MEKLKGERQSRQFLSFLGKKEAEAKNLQPKQLQQPVNIRANQRPNKALCYRVSVLSPLPADLIGNQKASRKQ